MLRVPACLNEPLRRAGAHVTGAAAPAGGGAFLCHACTAVRRSRIGFVVRPQFEAQAAPAGRDEKGRLLAKAAAVPLADDDERMLSSWDDAMALFRERAGEAGASINWQERFRFSRLGSDVVELGNPRVLLFGADEDMYLSQRETDASAGVHVDWQLLYIAIYS